MKRCKINLEISAELYQEFGDRCRAEGRTRSAVVRALIGVFVHDDLDPFAIASSQAATASRR